MIYLSHSVQLHRLGHYYGPVEVASDLECTLAWLVLRPDINSVTDHIHRFISIICVKLTRDSCWLGGLNDEVEDEDEYEYDRLVGRPWGDGDRPNLGGPN